jgi:hypothetical protein
VHEPACPDDGVDRACVDALAAADAGSFIDHRAGTLLMLPATRIEGSWGHREQPRQRRDGYPVSRWAPVDSGAAGSNGFGIGTAMGIAAARALRLRETGIDSGNQFGRGANLHRQSIAWARGSGNGEWVAAGALAGAAGGAYTWRIGTPGARFRSTTGNKP